MIDKKALKEQYLQMKPDMGVFMIRSKNSHFFHLEAATDLKSRMNGASFKLNAGGYPNMSLQKAWSAEGESAFYFEILEKLSYREEEGVNYKEELEVLKSVLEDELISQGLIPYRR